jgi:hypothetical protein
MAAHFLNRPQRLGHQIKYLLSVHDAPHTLTLTIRKNILHQAPRDINKKSAKNKKKRKQQSEAKNEGVAVIDCRLFVHCPSSIVLGPKNPRPSAFISGYYCAAAIKNVAAAGCFAVDMPEAV